MPEETKTPVTLDHFKSFLADERTRLRVGPEILSHIKDTVDFFETIVALGYLEISGQGIGWEKPPQMPDPVIPEDVAPGSS